MFRTFSKQVQLYTILIQGIITIFNWPNANLSSKKCTLYAGITIFCSLPPSETIKNTAKLKAALRKFLHTHTPDTHSHTTHTHSHTTHTHIHTHTRTHTLTHTTHIHTPHTLTHTTYTHTTHTPHTNTPHTQTTHTHTPHTHITHTHTTHSFYAAEELFTCIDDL